MSTPAEGAMGFDPILTGWLAKDNAAKVRAAAPPDESTPIYGAYAKVYDWLYSAVTGKLAPIAKQTISTQAQVDVARAGGSKSDIAQVAQDVASVFQMNEDNPPDVGLDWSSIAILAVVLFIGYLLLSEVL